MLVPSTALRGAPPASISFGSGELSTVRRPSTGSSTLSREGRSHPSHGDNTSSCEGVEIAPVDPEELLQDLGRLLAERGG